MINRFFILRFPWKRSKRSLQDMSRAICDDRNENARSQPNLPHHGGGLPTGGVKNPSRHERELPLEFQRGICDLRSLCDIAR
jgi:hypothetical protein